MDQPQKSVSVSLLEKEIDNQRQLLAQYQLQIDESCENEKDLSGNYRQLKLAKHNQILDQQSYFLWKNEQYILRLCHAMFGGNKEDEEKILAMQAKNFSESPNFTKIQSCL